MFNKIKETADFLIEKTNAFDHPKIGIILGTGLGDFVNELKIEIEINYENIPNFPVSTVESHKGKLLFGEINKKKVVVLQGRFHYYEGYSFNEIAFPVRVLKLLGIQTLLVSNAAGGLNPTFSKGDIMIISDHINQFPGNPLIGKNIADIGNWFPDMHETYSKMLMEMTELVAVNLGI